MKNLGILLLGILFLVACSNNQPKKLSKKTETIEVLFVNWACDCADFIETKYYKLDSSYEIKEDDCIFIEADSRDKKIPDSYFDKEHLDYNVKLTGKFYLDKGIPQVYERKTEESPKKARVFRYESYELVKRN